MSGAAAVSILAAVLGAAPVPRPALRQDLAAFGQALDAAVRRTSRSSIGAGGFGCRSYVIQGYGAVFVLPPRSLPGQLPPLWAEQGPELERALQAMEQAAARLDSPEARRAVEGHLARLRSRLPPATAARPEELAAAEQRARDAASEAERVRLESELALEAVRQGLAPRAAPAPPDEALLPPPPPWQAWFETDDDRRAPATLMRDVQEAVTAVLDAQGGRLKSLAPEEHVVVAVDFVPRGALAGRGRAERTLVLRARMQDLADRAQGKLSAEQLRQRVLAEEY